MRFLICFTFLTSSTLSLASGQFICHHVSGDPDWSLRIDLKKKEAQSDKAFLGLTETLTLIKFDAARNIYFFEKKDESSIAQIHFFNASGPERGMARYIKKHVHKPISYEYESEECYRARF